MQLNQLLSILPEYKASAPEIEVLSLTQDARQVHLGSVFVAIKGAKADGHEFINNACQDGAIALIIEKGHSTPPGYSGFVLVVENTREAMDRLAAQFYAHPSKEMFCFGVTGTNGKTSVTYMLECILNKVRIPCGVLGTINHHFEDRVWPTEMTTPDAIQLQKRLREMKEAGAKAIAMEISSHALSQHRADCVHFNTTIFTNLTRDHLDYHQSMHEYFLAKQKLFTDLLWMTEKQPHFAVINIDDHWGARMKVAGNAGLWSCGQNRQADFCYEITQVDFARTDFILKTPFGTFHSHIPMCGAHNVANAVAAVAAAASSGIAISVSLEALTYFSGVPGRLQFVSNNKSLNVFVDYAHTPDALVNVLSALNKVRKESQSPASIWTIFGCGGDRDKGKRPLMAQEAAKFSDHVMVTSDNPRTENASAILEEILAGFSPEDQKSKVLQEVDRRQAIQKVLAMAKPHDVILIAGKGHEDYQIVGQERHHFSDVKVAQESML